MHTKKTTVSFETKNGRVTFKAKPRKPKYKTIKAMKKGMKANGVHPAVIAQAVKVKKQGGIF